MELHNSIGSADLEALLASLRIGGRAPGGEAKRVNYTQVWDSASPGAAPAAAVAPAAVAPPPPRTVESEVVDLLSSDDEAEAYDLEDGEESEVVIIEEEEEDWVIAAPATGRKPRRDLVESSESGSESEASGSESDSSGSEASGSDDYGAADVAAAAPPALLSSLAAVLPPGARAPPAAPPRRAPPPADAAAPTPAKAAAAFRRDRAALSAAVFADLNARVFGGRLPADLAITWNARLATTAGLTHYARPAAGAPTARVELSAKVVDSAARLERTLAHELCHAAAWLLDGVAKPPHGAAFKAWAAHVVAAAPHLEVSTCHTYEIFRPFRWQCAACQLEYGRHSNSLDVAKKVCGACRGRLVFLGKFSRDGARAAPRAPTAFSAFVQENYAAAAREGLAGAPAASVMKKLSARWAAERAAAERRAAGGVAPAERRAAAAGGAEGGGAGGAAGGIEKALEFLTL